MIADNVENAPPTFLMLDSVKEAVRLWLAAHGKPIPGWLQWELEEAEAIHARYMREHQDTAEVTK